jgi:hypothetical protein
MYRRIPDRRVLQQMRVQDEQNQFALLRATGGADFGGRAGVWWSGRKVKPNFGEGAKRALGSGFEARRELTQQ